jgi:hypothetical protein
VAHVVRLADGRERPQAMADKSEISHEDFIAACCTVAAVVADGWWQSTQATGSRLKRPSAVASSAAMDCQSAAKYCGFGRTRFRELVAGGVFPEPVTVEGRKRWLTTDLDRALARLRKEQRQRG